MGANEHIVYSSELHLIGSLCARMLTTALLWQYGVVFVQQMGA